MSKKTVKIGLSLIVLCLAIVLGYVVTHISEKREPTAQELEAYAPYTVNWQEATGREGGEKEIILSLSSFAGKETIGNNIYDVYESDTLGQYLHNFSEMMQLAVLEDTLYVQYTTPAGDLITLGYDGDGLCELGIYTAAEDTMYYKTRDTEEVWTKFRNGFQFGK